MKKRIGVFVNPTSGHGKGARILRMLADARAHDPLLKNRVTAICATPATADGIPAVIEALKTCDVALVCGGDGTVHQMADLIVRHAPETALAVFPLGTGNDFARQLGPRPKSVIAHLQKIAAAPSFGAIDVWTLNGELLFTNYVSFGFDGWILSLYQTALKHLEQTGFFGFALAKKMLFVLVGGWALLFHGKRAPMTDGAPLSVIVCNIAWYAGGARFGTGGKPDDGRIELMKLPGKGAFLRLTLSRFIPGIAPAAATLDAPLTFTFTEAVPLQADGEDYSARFAAIRAFTITRAGAIKVCA
ncbi:MAG: hypothetical protein HZA03_11430 [Nitrospinae bacterium]|nr:hypothetical protein [Nitrospinota bacterium]